MEARPHDVAGGVRFATRRKVFPRLGPRNAVAPFPTLVWIEIDDPGVDLAGQGGRVTAQPVLG